MNKNEMRNKMKTVRAGIEGRARKDKLIENRVIELARDFEKIFIYVSMGTEVSTHGIINRLRKSKEIYVPYTQADKTMHACRLTESSVFDKVDSMGNTESASGEYFDGQADLVIVPLLGFDGDCHRLGYGAGCYDRYFNKYPAGLKAGLAYSQQLCRFEHESTDIPLDIIITPESIIRRSA